MRCYSCPEGTVYATFALPESQMHGICIQRQDYWCTDEAFGVAVGIFALNADAECPWDAVDMDEKHPALCWNDCCAVKIYLLFLRGNDATDDDDDQLPVT